MALKLTANYQDTDNGVLTVSALHVSLLNGTAAAGDLAKVTVGKNIVPTVCNPFTGLDETNAFCQDIKWWRTDGIADGYDDGGYHPAAHISRQAVAAWVHRYSTLYPRPSR